MQVARNPGQGEILHVLWHMRAADRREVYALRFVEDDAALAAEFGAASDTALRHLVLGADDGEPVALLGAWLASPGVAQVHMVATDRWREIANAAHRYVVRRFIPEVLGKVRRAQCEVWTGHTVARAWLLRLGFLPEGLRVGLGKNGEAFIPMAWHNPACPPPPAGDGQPRAARQGEGEVVARDTPAAPALGAAAPAGREEAREPPPSSLPANTRATAAARPAYALSGDACRVCGNFTLARTGKCQTCQACGASDGCA